LAKKKKDDVEYYGQHEPSILQNKYFAHYDYNFWMHKAHMLWHFVEYPESAKGLKFEGDIFEYDVIVLGLKMELHMTAMHCTESFFRIIHAMLFNPELPWLGMAECTHRQLNNFIKYIKNNGIIPLVPNASEWLRINIYPTIDEKHDRYERSKKSISDFVIPYLQRLAHEFSTHTEYNAYKHGLHCFPAIGSLQAFGDDSGQKYLDSTNDIIQYLDIIKEGNNKKKVRITDKSYSTTVGYNIIRTNSAILHNIHLVKSIAAGDRMTGIPNNIPIHHGYYYLDDWTVEEIFNDSSSRSVKKLTY
jgi:hypothetical protein